MGILGTTVSEEVYENYTDVVKTYIRQNIGMGFTGEEERINEEMQDTMSANQTDDISTCTHSQTRSNRDSNFVISKDEITTIGERSIQSNNTDFGEQLKDLFALSDVRSESTRTEYRGKTDEMECEIGQKCQMSRRSSRVSVSSTKPDIRGQTGVIEINISNRILELTDCDHLSQVINNYDVDEEKNKEDINKLKNKPKEISRLPTSECKEISRFQYQY